ncbi:MAG: hypothetical protein ABIF40_05660 [archaeon]
MEQKNIFSCDKNREPLRQGFYLCNNKLTYFTGEYDEEMGYPIFEEPDGERTLSLATFLYVPLRVDIGWLEEKVQDMKQ